MPQRFASWALPMAPSVLPIASVSGATFSSASDSVDCKSTACRSAFGSPPSISQGSSTASSAPSSDLSAMSPSCCPALAMASGSCCMAAAAARHASRTWSPTTPSNWLGSSPILDVSLFVCRSRRNNFATSLWLGAAFGGRAPASPSASSSAVSAMRDSCCAIRCATRRSSTAVSPSMTRSSSWGKRLTSYSSSSLLSSSPPSS
mmetsp:Transcript_64013/g.206215  ORF Transcript_64013/g.206215 Transcript_64013/m.206215 type:complete len:204 (+) Transcript_64013:944-1555(+)